MAAIPASPNYSGRPTAVVIVNDDANPFAADGASKLTLANNASMATGASLPANGVLIPKGGNYRWQVIAGSFGGGTLSLQALAPDGTTWIPFDPVASLTANGGLNVGIPDGSTVRMNMAGGTGATNLYATLARVTS